MSVALPGSNKKEKRLSLSLRTKGHGQSSPAPIDEKPTPLILRSDDIKGNEVLIEHFTQPRPLPKMPWEMEYEERRHNSKDPRIQKQLAESRQWQNTCMEGIWDRLLCFTSPDSDWNMTQDDFRNWLSYEGIRSSFLKEKLLLIFDPPQSDVGSRGAIPSMKKCYNALKVCKVLEAALLTYPYQDLFIQHCYERFDRPVGTDRVSQSLIMATQLRETNGTSLPAPGAGRAAVVGPFDDDTNPFKVKGKKGASKKRRSVGGLKTTMASGASYRMVEALKAIIVRGDFESMREDRTRIETAKSTGLSKIEKKPDVVVVDAKPPVTPRSSFLLGSRQSSTPTSQPVHLPSISETAPRFEAPRPGSPPAAKPIHQFVPSLLASQREYSNDAPISADEITYNMFKAAFLDPVNAKSLVACFGLPILEAASKYFAPPRGELPLVSMRWERAMAPIPTMTFKQIIEATVGPTPPSAKQPQRQRKKSTTLATESSPPTESVAATPSAKSLNVFEVTPHTANLEAAVPAPPRFCPYDADSLLLKECEQLGGVDPWRVPPKKKKNTKK